MPTWDDLQARVSKTLVAPLWVVRPAPIEVSRADAGLDDGEGISKSAKPASMCGLVLLCIFKYLPVNDLLSVMRVCREWSRWSIHHSLWPRITLPPNKPVLPVQLEGIVRRQPSKLTLNWVIISQEQLKWLLTRLPQLSEAEFEGLSWGEVRCLSTCYSPPLVKLNLNFCEGVNDDAIKQFLSSPVSRRPGFRNHQASRMKSITHLSLAGSFISDVSIKALCSELQLIHLDISNCMLVTENTIEIIASKQSETLESLDVRACSNLSPLCLPFIVKLKLMSSLSIDHCDLIPPGATRAWAQTHGYTVGKDLVLTRIPPSIRKANLAFQSRLVKTTFQEILRNHIKKLSQNAGFTNVSRPASAQDCKDTIEVGAEIKCEMPIEESKPSTSRLAEQYASSTQGNVLDAISKDKKKVTAKEVSQNEVDSYVKGSARKMKSTKVFKHSDNLSDIGCKECFKDSEIEKELVCDSDETHLALTEDVSPSHSEKSPTRPRRRPSRFADPEMEFTSPSKTPRKKMKQVSVKLEDISPKFSRKELAGSPSRKFAKKLSDQSEKVIAIGPKSRCPPRNDEITEDSKPTHLSEIDSISIPTVDVISQSPRRTQRRSKESLEEIKDKITVKGGLHISESKKFKENEIKFLELDDKQTQSRKFSADEIKKDTIVSSSNVDKMLPKKEKDIMTRSKRLKQSPSKENDNGAGTSSELPSPRVMICRKDAELSHSKGKNKLGKLLCKVKSPENISKSLKRSRSLSSSDSTVNLGKKIEKEANESDSVYSSKLRKKSIEGIVTSEVQSELLKKGHETRIRRRSFKDEEEKGIVDSSVEESSSELVTPKIPTSKERSNDIEAEYSKLLKSSDKKKVPSLKAEIRKKPVTKVSANIKEVVKLNEPSKNTEAVVEKSKICHKKESADKPVSSTLSRKNSKHERSEKINANLPVSTQKEALENVDVKSPNDKICANLDSKMNRKNSSEKLHSKSKEDKRTKHLISKKDQIPEQLDNSTTKHTKIRSTQEKNIIQDACNMKKTATESSIPEFRKEGSDNSLQSTSSKVSRPDKQKICLEKNEIKKKNSSTDEKQEQIIKLTKERKAVESSSDKVRDVSSARGNVVKQADLKAAPHKRNLNESKTIKPSSSMAATSNRSDNSTPQGKGESTENVKNKKSENSEKTSKRKLSDVEDTSGYNIVKKTFESKSVKSSDIDKKMQVSLESLSKTGIKEDRISKNVSRKKSTDTIILKKSEKELSDKLGREKKMKELAKAGYDRMKLGVKRQANLAGPSKKADTVMEASAHLEEFSQKPKSTLKSVEDTAKRSDKALVFHSSDTLTSRSEPVTIKAKSFEHAKEFVKYSEGKKEGISTITYPKQSENVSKSSDPSEYKATQIKISSELSKVNYKTKSITPDISGKDINTGERSTTSFEKGSSANSKESGEKGGFAGIQSSRISSLADKVSTDINVENEAQLDPTKSSPKVEDPRESGK